MRDLPHNPHAERSLLCAMLFTPERVYDGLRGLGSAGSRAFYVESHREICAALEAMQAASEPIDFASVTQRVRPEIRHEVMALSDAALMASNVEVYAAEVYELWRKREIAAIGKRLAVEALSGDSADDVLTRAQNALEAARGIREDDRPLPMDEIIPDVIAQFQSLAYPTSTTTPAIGSGVPLIDRVLHGYPDDEITLIAARPSVGKTALALWSAYHAAKSQGARSLFFSLEMSRDRLAKRLLQIEGVNVARFNSGFIAKQELGRAIEAQQVLDGIPIYVDQERQKCSSIMAKARRFVRQHGRTLILIDYLQYIPLDSDTEKTYRAIGENVKRLKNLSKELQCPVVLLAQLSREAEDCASGYEMLRCMYESGNIEQDIDNAIILHQPKNKEERRDSNIIPTAITIAKGRNWGTGHAVMVFNREQQRFFEVQGDAA